MVMYPAKVRCWQVGVNLHTVIIVDGDAVSLTGIIFNTDAAAEKYADDWNQRRLSKPTPLTALDNERIDAYVNRAAK